MSEEPNIVIKEENRELKVWTKDGMVHRDNGPAVILESYNFSAVEYFRDGVLYRKQFLNEKGEITDEVIQSVDSDEKVTVYGSVTGMSSMTVLQNFAEKLDGIKYCNNDSDYGYIDSYDNGDFSLRVCYKKIDGVFELHNDIGPALIDKDGLEAIFFNGKKLVTIYPEQKEWVEDFIFEDIPNMYEQLSSFKYENAESFNSVIQEENGEIVRFKDGKVDFSVSRFENVGLKTENEIVDSGLRIQTIRYGNPDKSLKTVKICKDISGKAGHKSFIIEEYYENKKLQKVVRKNINGEIHCDFSPAVEIGNFNSYNKDVYYSNDTGFFSRESGEGRLEYWTNGKLEKIIHVNKDGKPHMENGEPAIIIYPKTIEGTEFWGEEWWVNGERYRKDGLPVVEITYSKPEENVKAFVKEYWSDGNLKRIERCNEDDELSSVNGMPSVEDGIFSSFVYDNYRRQGFEIPLSEGYVQFHENGKLVREIHGSYITRHLSKTVDVDRDAGLVNISNYEEGEVVGSETISLEDFENESNSCRK